MPETTIPENSLVLYKGRPAYVNRVANKIEIEREDGKTLLVRPKDVELLHPGPLASLADLVPQAGEVHTAWELLAGSSTDLAELTELIYGEYTPATAWAAWQEVIDGLYFGGTPEIIEVHLPDAVAEERERRAARQAEERAWSAFVERAQAGHVIPEDEGYLRDVEDLALKRRANSRVLQALGREETPENAHALLLELGCWSYEVNPYPVRLGAPTSAPDISLPDLPGESRVDLTHLPAFAIDDRGNQDPDDALSLEQGRLWVHIADAAALVPPDTPADQEARVRGASLYLPEETVPMLPPEAVHVLGLGLTDVSPALSFGLDLGAAGEVTALEIIPSWVRVTRLTYEEVEARLSEEPFQSLYNLAEIMMARRRAAEAVNIDLPEIKIRVIDGRVHIWPLPPLRSRDLVREAMLLCGEALAHFARTESIPIPFVVQSGPSEYELIEGLAGMFAIRRAMKPSQRTGEAGPHAGLGLFMYTQATSPLRRYADLVVHQQLRAYLRGESLLDSQAILERIGAAEAVSGSVRLAERLAVKHWTLVYLLQHPDWQGEGVLVDKRGSRGLVLIPELDLETWLSVPRKLPLNAPLGLNLRDVNLPMLEAYFKIKK